MPSGGGMVVRPLHFFWIVDCSGSMFGNKLQSLNAAIRESIPEMRRVAQLHPHVQVLVHAIKFSSGALWHVLQPTPIESFQWQDLKAGGVTDMGKAFLLLAEQLKTPLMEPRGLPPVLALICDGQPTDDAHRGIRAIMDLPWGKKAVRLAIGIGADLDHDVLEKFIDNPAIPPLIARNPDQLTHYIRWASTTVVQAASTPTIQPDAQESGLSSLQAVSLTLPDVPAAAFLSTPEDHSVTVW